MGNEIKVGINGFGRIGRKVVRLALEKDSGIEIAGINDPNSLDALAHLLKYDSSHKEYGLDVHTEGNTLVVGPHKIPVSASRDPLEVPWSKWGVEIVHECSGHFTTKEKAGLHVQSGAKKVIISAPAKDPDVTICMGVNQEDYKADQHQIISNASCTTNCLAPLAKVIDTEFGIVRGTMTTVHSYTNDQRILDLPHKDLRRARAAAVSQIPTTTGAAKAVGLVLPQLKGKLDGMAIRVPTPNVSLVDFVVETNKNTTEEEINAAIKKASETSMKGVIDLCEKPLVSIDFNGNTHSSTIDAELTRVIDGNFIKVISWYDNESGFSARMLDLTHHVAQK